MNEFILALALICPNKNSVSVQEVLTTKPLPYEECDSRVDKLRSGYFKKKGDCELDLICVRVHWQGTVEKEVD